MGKSKLRRLAALMRATGPAGKEVERYLRWATQDAPGQPAGSFNTFQRWQRYQRERLELFRQGSRCADAAAFDAALARLEEEQTRNPPRLSHEERWREERGRYLLAHPEEVQTRQDHQLAREAERRKAEQQKSAEKPSQ